MKDAAFGLVETEVVVDAHVRLEQQDVEVVVEKVDVHAFAMVPINYIETTERVVFSNNIRR